MQTLTVNFSSGQHGIFSVPDDFGIDDIHSLLGGGTYAAEFDTGNDDIGHVTVGLRGSHIISMLLAGQGQLIADPNQATATQHPADTHEP